MIVLTGGAGFIGSCFLEKLNTENITDVLVVDRLGTELKWKNLIGKKFLGFEHKTKFREDLSNGKFGKEVEAIIHFGACSSTTEKDADYLLDNNFNYSKDMAKFAARNEIKFIYASSAATYGIGENGYSDSEFDKLRPLNMYGFSKHLFDLWVIENKLDKSFTGLKFFNVFGPNEYHKGGMASMVYKAYNQIVRTGKMNLFKSNTKEFRNGGQKRDFIYVKDVVEVVWKIFNNKKFAGIYNLGTGKAKSWNDLGNAVFKAMDKEAKIDYIEMPDDLKSQYQNFTQADMSKLNKVLGKFKFQELENSIEDYVKNYLIKGNYL